MAGKATLDQVTLDDIMPKVRLDKAVVTYHKGTPSRLAFKDVRVFRASSIAKMCPVEAAFAVKLIKAKKKTEVLAWARSRELKAELTEIVNTGTVIHTQLQYYAGITGKVRKGQWKCAHCGFYTHKKVPMPVIETLDPLTDLDLTYPAPCPRCKGKNLAEFPPWKYVEVALVEKIKGIPDQLKIRGHTDGLFEVRVRVGDKLVWVPILIDYKTINRNGFEERYGHLPRDGHVPQMQVYLNLADVEFGVLDYSCKDNSKHKYIGVKRDREFWKVLLRRVNWARKGNMKNKSKYRVCPTIGSPRARECFFCQACWGKKPHENFIG